MSQASSSVHGRSSTASSKTSPRDRPGGTVDPQQQASQIEKSVTHLLVATKQLLETLTQWSRGTQTEADVSDVYVRLGYEFNIACRSFSQVGIDTSDLGNVPDTLRVILEETLSQEATQASLDKFLPKIRDIIINLLHGLKRKQQKLRAKTGRDGGSERRQQSLVGTLNSMGDESQPSRDASRDASQTSRREGSRELSDSRSLHHSGSSGGTSSPQRQDSSGASEPRRSGSSGRNTHQYPASSDPATQQPPLPPYPQESAIPAPATSPPTQDLPRPPPRETAPVPRPPPKQQDALAALQRGGELERRASRRFSAYQIHKTLGTSSVGVPVIPAAQRSPIPNRGRDIRESMNAVKSRGSQVQRSRSRHGSSRSPERKAESVTNIRQSLRDPTLDSNAPSFAPPAENADPGSPNVKTPEDKYPKPPPYTHEPLHEPGMRATITKPWDDGYPIPELVEPDAQSAQSKQDEPVPKYEKGSPTKDTPNEVAARQSLAVEPLTLFLQYKTKVKKFVLPGGYEELSMARLQLAFIEKFSWNTHSSSVDLPEIYIQDPVSGVRHELDDLNDVKNHSVLVLNVDSVDEVKRHFDDGMIGIRNLLDGIKVAVSDQSASIQRVSDKQQDTAKDLARFATNPLKSAPSQSPPNGVIRGPKGSQSQLDEVRSLRRELAVMRQTYTSHMTAMDKDMDAIKVKAKAVKEATSKATNSSTAGDSGRSYLNKSKEKISEDSESVINRVDDLQDTVEDLRKDVTRGVRPLPRQLESVSKDISAATADLKKLRDLLESDKPIWKKIGEDELKEIMDDQETLRIQGELTTDLEDDLEKLSQTFALVEQASKQQNLQNGVPGTTRSTSRTLNPVPDLDPMKAKDTVMGEVRALQPNHESRLEAIERAEKARQVELDSRANNAFKKELGNFVEENKLRKTGGVEEAERLRIKRDDEARKENFQRMAERRARQDADAAAAAQAPVVPEPDSAPSVTDGIPKLDIPGLDDGGTTSPEPEFLEAQESPLANGAVPS